MANEQFIGNKNDSVIVGCKLATGLWAELMPEPTSAPDGQVRRPAPMGKRVLLNGANSAASTAALGGTLIRVNPRVLNFGKTAVDRSFWEQWSKQDVAKSLIGKGFVFVVNKETESKAQTDFKAQAREKLPEKTGLEGLDPNGNDERMKAISVPGRQETQIETDREHLNRLQKELTEAA